MGLGAKQSATKQGNTRKLFKINRRMKNIKPRHEDIHQATVKRHQVLPLWDTTLRQRIPARMCMFLIDIHSHPFGMVMLYPLPRVW